MSKLGTIVKTASGVIATTIALFTALRENPQISAGIDDALAKLKEAARSDKPKTRFEAKLAAIEAAADAVDQTFPDPTDPDGWRRQTRALRVRGDLAWNANTGAPRRRALKALNAETAEILTHVNTRLVELHALPGHE